MSRFKAPGLLLLTVSLLLASASSAGAASQMMVGVADDGLMQRDPFATELTAQQWQQNGVGFSRLTLVWTRIAPSPNSIKKPAGFNARNPDSAGYYWADVDRAVNSLEKNNIKISIAVASPAPYWVSTSPKLRSPSYRPAPKALADFLYAVAKRYKGRILSYIPLNEPNLSAYLMPQYECPAKPGSSCYLAGAAQYRQLYRAAYSSIKTADPAAAVWIGPLAPHGKKGRSPGPTAFFKAMTCLKDNYAIDVTSPGCESYTPLMTDGIAHHPHTLLLSPTERDPGDAVTTANLSTLTSLFDVLQSKGRIFNSSSGDISKLGAPLDLFIDEYGVQTNPPDNLQGLSQAKQNDYYQQVAYMMWKNPRVKLLSFYLWKDEPTTKAKSWAWQSGVYFHDGKAKASAASFPHPFWLTSFSSRRAVKLWGQARAHAASTVWIQSKQKGSKLYSTEETLVSDQQGFFLTKLPSSTGTRFRYCYGSPRKCSGSRAAP